MTKTSSIHHAAIRHPAAQATVLGSLLAVSMFPVQSAAEEVEADQSGTIIVVGQREADSNPNANANAPFKIERSANDRLTEELRDTPRSVSVIPKEVIEAIGATSFREVVRSTPGVTLGTGEGGNAFGDRIFIRGFDARNDVYIDGLRDPGVTSREIFAVEQIEIIKGPSGSFGGRGTTGGLVSLQSKRPRVSNSFVVAEVGVGTDSFLRGTVDANYAVSDKFAVRVNAMGHSADTAGRDFVESDRYGFTGSVFWQATPIIALTADYYHARMDGIPDFGHPFNVATQEPYQVDRANFYGVIGRDFIKNGADIGTFRIDITPSETLSIRSVTRYGETTNRYIVGTPGGVCRVARTGTTAGNPLSGTCPTGGTSATIAAPLIAVPESAYTLNAGSQRRWATNRYLAHTSDATLRFETGALRHTMVAGFELAREKVDTFALTIPAFVEDAQGNPASTSTFVRNLLNPNPVVGFDIPVTPDLVLGPTKTTVRSASAYLIDTIRITPQLRVVVGGRFDSYDIDFANPDGSTAAGLQPVTLASSAEFANVQTSLLYKPVDALTLYASYATSSNPSGEQLDGNGVSYDGIAAQTQNLEPERNRAWEAGAKWESDDGEFLLTAAVFQITKANTRENIGGGVYDTVGKLRARGIELSATGTIFDRLQVFGGYTFNDAKIVQSVTLANVGRRFANIPRHSGNLLLTYRLTDRVELGGQVYAQDRIYGGALAAGSASVPGYARFDAVARWKPTGWLEARANVLNLTNTRYYDAIYRSGTPFAYIAPGRSATLTLTMTY